MVYESHEDFVDSFSPYFTDGQLPPAFCWAALNLFDENQRLRRCRIGKVLMKPKA